MKSISSVNGKIKSIVKYYDKDGNLSGSCEKDDIYQLSCEKFNIFNIMELLGKNFCQ
ncbi:MAG: hypothetical protein LBT51_09165 [Fusobacteriaceae bacterium]|jgi:hypothetical protein|nr:hypothetical protein [Fusobacteriaceae bacterium]